MNTPFTAYNATTGQVQFSGTSYLPEQLQTADISILLGAIHEGGWIEGGQHFTQSPRPSEHHAFDWMTRQWLDPRTLQDFKAAKWTTIKAAREGAIDAPLMTPYGTVDCKAKDRNNITDAVLMLKSLADMGTPSTIDFTLADNTTATLTTAQMVNVGLLLGQKVQTAHAHSRLLRTSIEAATTAEQVEAVQW